MSDNIDPMDRYIDPDIMHRVASGTGVISRKEYDKQIAAMRAKRDAAIEKYGPLPGWEPINDNNG